MATEQALSEDAMAAWVGFLRAHSALVDLLEHDLQQEVGLPLSWYEVLLHLARTPGGRLRMQELAAAVVLSKSGLTRLVDRMVDAGYVVRVSCPSDRRGIWAEITPAGRRTLRRAQPVHLRGIRRHFADPLDPAQLVALRIATERLLGAAGEGPAEAACTA